jgi:hypothetical protein
MDEAREEMINELVNQIDDWDLETLIDWAKDVRRQSLEQETDKRLKEIYQVEILGE